MLIVKGDPKRSPYSYSGVSMQYRIFLSLFLCISLRAERVVADKLLAIIYHPEGTTLVCQSDIKPDLSERTPTLQDAIVKELIILDGKKLQIPVSDAEVDKALARAQEALGIDRAGLIEMFKKQGFTLDQARKELYKTIMAENVIEARVRSKAHVPEKKLREFHETNPLELYGLKQSLVPYKGGSKSLTRTLVEREVESGAIKNSVDWLDIGIINGQDFSQEKAHIKNLSVGSVVIADETDEGISLLQLASKKVVSFEDRKQEIASKMIQERFTKAQADYFDTLLKEANIKYL